MRRWSSIVYECQVIAVRYFVPVDREGVHVAPNLLELVVPAEAVTIAFTQSHASSRDSYSLRLSSYFRHRLGFPLRHESVRIHVVQHVGECFGMHQSMFGTHVLQLRRQCAPNLIDAFARPFTIVGTLARDGQSDGASAGAPEESGSIPNAKS